MEVTSEIGRHEKVFLELEYQASEPYTRFVYDSVEQALGVRRFLLKKHLCEFSPPYGKMLINETQPLGMLAYLMADDLHECRLRGTFALHKSEFFRQDPALRNRFRLASQTLVKLQKGDLYGSRIAAAEAARGKGVGRFLMNYLEQEAKRLGCKRVVLEVSPANEPAVHLYKQQQFTQFDVRRVVDSPTGRSLEYIHMEKSLA